MTDAFGTPAPTPGTAQRYLGDGVYATWDGFAFALDLRAQASPVHTTRIVLEQEVASAFIQFITEIRGLVEA